MDGSRRLPRIFIVAGLIVAILGALDPLEGSIAVVAGTGLITLGAFLGKSPKRKIVAWSLALVIAGVIALFALSAAGGIGGSSSRTLWWGLILLPYPAGWIMALAGAILCLRKPKEDSI